MHAVGTKVTEWQRGQGPEHDGLLGSLCTWERRVLACTSQSECLYYTNDRPPSTILRRHVVSASARSSTPCAGLAGLGGLIYPTAGIIE